MKVFVTGGSGFVGERLIRRLKADKHEVVALARGSSQAEKIRATGAQRVHGTFSNISEWETALDGMDAVVHCAAPVEFWGKWEDFYRDTVQATIDLYQAASRRKVGRFIQISSESVIQDKLPLLDIDETAPYPSVPSSVYGRAKKETEIALCAQPTGPVRIILRPTFIWGKGVKALDTMAQKVTSGEFMWIDHGQTIIEMVHVDNVVQAIVLSLGAGSDKSIYYVTDDRPMKVFDFFSALFAAAAIPIPKKNMNGKIAALAAGAIEGVWKLFGIQKSPPLSRFELAFVAQPRRYNIAKIKRELGYSPVKTLEAGLAEMR